MRVCKEASGLNRLKHGAFSAGLKASKKALAANRAGVIYIARDAEARIISEISQICKDNGIIYDPNKCFEYMQEFPEDKKQISIFDL